MNYTLTRENVGQQLAAIRTRAQALTIGLDESALNWQPDGARQWSIAQCLHHLARRPRQTCSAGCSSGRSSRRYASACLRVPN